jgi:hypothetical protein
VHAQYGLRAATFGCGGNKHRHLSVALQGEQGRDLVGLGRAFVVSNGDYKRLREEGDDDATLLYCDLRAQHWGRGRHSPHIWTRLTRASPRGGIPGSSDFGCGTKRGVGTNAGADLDGHDFSQSCARPRQVLRRSGHSGGLTGADQICLLAMGYA